MRVVCFILFMSVCVVLHAGGTAGFETDHLWKEIHSLNRELAEYSGSLSSQALERSFGRTVNILKNTSLGDEFERLREDAFTRNDFTRLDAAVAQCRPAVDAFILGESNSFGVNVGFFLEKCEPEDGAREFLTLAKDGFYITECISGTASFPKWIERTESSCQGVVRKSVAAEYLERWKTLFSRSAGLYRELASETVRALSIELEGQ